MVFVIGCGDNLGGGSAGSDGGNGGSGDGGGDGPDASTIECDPPAAGAPGSACSEPEDCDSTEGAGDGRCLNADQREVNWPETGYCVRICGEDATDCGEGTTCFAQDEAPMVLCMPLCCEEIACASGLACSTLFLGEEIGAAVCLPGDPSAADGAPCDSVADCNSNSNCELDEQGGTSGNCSTVCDSDEDCATGDGQRCDPEDMFCRHSVIGDPCEADGECGQTPWDCLTEADDDRPAGYCTIPCGDGCPDGTVCNDDLLGDLDPHCVEACTLADGCPREDYSCLDVATGGLELGCVPDII